MKEYQNFIRILKKKKKVVWVWACEPDCSAQRSQKRELDLCSWGHRHCEPLHRVLEPELGSFTRALTLYSLNCSAISPDSVFLIIHPNFNSPEFIWCHVAKSFQFLSICTQLSLLVLLEQYHINSYGNETHCASKCAQW